MPSGIEALGILYHKIRRGRILIQQKQAQRNQLLQQLTGLAEVVVGVDGDALRLTDGVEVRLKSLSHRLAEQGIEKTVYELLAMPYLTEMGR